MSGQDPRNLLSAGQRALRAGRLDSARAAFLGAAIRFSGPAELVGGGHGLRGLAQVAIAEKDWDTAVRTLELADNTYALGLDLLQDAPQDDTTTELELSLVEGRATVGMVFADMEMRRGRFSEARKRVDSVYPLYRQLGDRPAVADLWVTTARLAEREGRWFTARTSWAQALRLRKSAGDEYGQCDALIRMAEAMLADGDVGKARPRLAAAEELARDLGVDALFGRVHMANAKVCELEHEYEAAWEKWLDAAQALRDADPLLRGLSTVRMARTAAVVRPAESPELLQKGLVDLLEAHHPDALGLVLHQLAIVALLNGDAKQGLLAAVGADRARNGEDDTVQGVVLHALLQMGAYEAAFALALYRAERIDEPDRRAMVELIRERLERVPDVEGTSLKRMRDEAALEIDVVVGPIARSRGLDVLEVGTRRAAMKLTGVNTEKGAEDRVQPAPLRSDVEAVVMWEIGETPESHVLNTGVSLIGRGADNAIKMGWDAEASRVHCALEVRDGSVRLRDLASTTGTFVGGEAIDGEVELSAGDDFRVGLTRFRLEFRETAQKKATVAIPRET